jgi:phosphonate transport system permease protein
MNANGLKRIFLDAFIFSYLITVLVVFIAEPTDSQKLNLGLNLGLYVGLFILCAFFSLLLSRWKIRTLGEKTFDPLSGPGTLCKKSIWKWQLFLFIVVSLAVGFHITQVSFLRLLEADSFYPTMKLFASLMNPNWELLPKAVLMMIETLYLAFIATSLAIPIAFVICFLAAKNIMKHPLAFLIYILMRTLLNFTRSVEAFVWAIIFTVWVGIGPFAGMLALMIHSVVSLAKQYSELVETVAMEPIEAIQATGANWIQTIWYGILPQVLLPFISFTIYRWDINIRMATIVGFVGGGGIGFLLQNYTSQAMWPEVGTIIFVIALVVWVMDAASAYIREALK